MHRAQVFLLRPNKVQAEYFSRSAGVTRMSYNWALAEWKRQALEWWESGKQTMFPTAFSLQKQFNAIKKETWPWITEISKLVPEAAIFAVGQAYDAYKAGQTRYPRFKCRGKSRESFLAAASYRECSIEGIKIKFPKIGWIPVGRECRWPNARIMKAVISKRAGKWYASVSFEISDGAVAERPNLCAGVDLGIKTPLTVACGGASIALGVGLLERLNVERRKLRRANKTLNRRVKGSNRNRLAKARVARIQKRISDIRSDFQHKATTTISSMAHRIGVETLHVKGLLRNGRLARHISDVGFFELKRQLAYKADILVEADRFYPSSKTCSCCGSVKEKLSLSDRVFVCEACGFICDRDENAARNLEKLAADRAVTARGDGSPARRRKLTLRSLSVKRESEKIGVSS
jgi:putative transposase